ncbi:MAG: hypothetical protein WCW66_05675 [Patescibacteria group bacterium]|jgi:hypothetical protein
MKKLALIFGAITIALFCLVAGNWYYAKLEHAGKETITESDAIETIKNQFLELSDYPSDTLPPRSIKLEKANNGWHVAFIQEGSGRPIISATCFFVDDQRNVTNRKTYQPTIEGGMSADFSVKECMLIDNEVAEENNNDCKLESCHGMEYECGDNPPEACDMMYSIGDKCLQYAECGTVNGICQQIDNPQFTQCKNCVQNCIDANGDNSANLFECESNCK